MYTIIKLKTKRLWQGERKKLLSHYWCLTKAPNILFQRKVIISVITHRWLRQYHSFLLFLSLLFSYVTEKNIMAMLKTIIPQGLDRIMPPCVCECVFWAIIAWPFLLPLLPIDCENRLRLIIHKNTVGVLTTLVAHGSKTRACVCMCVYPPLACECVL